MDELETPVKKVGRPATRAAARGRSSSLDGSPTLLVRTSIAQLVQATENIRVPQINIQPEDEMRREEAPAALLHAPDVPDPAATDDPVAQNPAVDARGPDAAPIHTADAALTAALPTEASPLNNNRTNKEQQTDVQLRRDVERIVEECHEFLDVHEGLQMNQTLIAWIEKESMRLTTVTTSCCNQIEDRPRLNDVLQELKRCRKTIKIFAASMMGSYNSTPALPAPSSAHNHCEEIPPTTTDPKPVEHASNDQKTTDKARTDEGIVTTAPPSQETGSSTTNSTSDATSPPPENVIPSCSPAMPPPDARDQQNNKDDAEQQTNSQLRKEAETIIEDCQEFIEDHEGLAMNQTLIAWIKEESMRLTTAITSCYNQIKDNSHLADVCQELRRWRRIIRTFNISMMSNFNTASQTPPTSVSQPIHQQRERRDPSPDTMDMVRQDLKFFMNKLRDDRLPDVGIGADVSNTELRDLFEATLPQITKAVDDCRKVLSTYTSKTSYDRELAKEAQQRCEDASNWTSDIIYRYRKNKLHLDKNTTHKEITFSAFKPGSDVSIYQFLRGFESWADGYLSEEAKADQLYHRYLDKSITESYAELTPLKEDTAAMKDWLIKKYGSVVPIAHGCIKSISKLSAPKELNHSANVLYLRSIHKLLASLSELEISRGVPVPKLQSYLGSNAFLSALIEVLPYNIKTNMFKELVCQGVDDHNSLEGRHHLPSIVRILKTEYRTLEWMVHSTPSVISTATNQTKPQNNNQQSGKPPKPSFPNAQQSTNVANTPKPASVPTTTQAPVHSPSNPPFLTGGNAVPINNSWQPSNQHAPQAQWNRWSCPIKDHFGHNITECVDFWTQTPRQRRFNCKYGGCYTCLEQNKTCRGGTCSRYQEVPADIICPDCAQSANQGRTPVCVLLCGMNIHRKPSQPELMRALEAWIPNLSFQRLGAQVQVNLTTLGFHSTSIMPPPPLSKTGPPTPNVSNMVYDTTTGDSRPLTHKDHVNRASPETAYYAMQTVRIRNQDVLMFYDSGSNGHLIEGVLAEQLRLDVLTSDSVPVGSLGGKAMWSEFGMYTVTLGPDMNGECHELEMQGIGTITNEIPEVDLQELWEEANIVLKGKRQMPIKIGGTSAHILVGIKSTHLGPKHMYSLPNGLGIYESVIYDIYQSNICFGGPHAIFTQAYKKFGMYANHVQVMFTEVARAYMDSPWNFIRADVDEHGPPLEFARESDLLNEISKAFPTTIKESRNCPSNTSVNHVILRKEIDMVPEVSDESVNTPTSNTLPEDTSPEEMEIPIKDLVPNQSLAEPEEEWTTFNNLLNHCEHINCMKSFIPLSKLKGLQDELDIPEIVDFRCDSCANCPTCKLSARAKTKSLQESFEQQVIEKSVHVNLQDAKVWVDLPFIKEPVEYLTKKHGGSNNFNQGVKVYQAQCRKRDDVKDQVRKAHQELVEKGYMTQLNELPTHLQNIINNAQFHHYYPWRAVYKEDSVTTPVRLVVDPTMTGLNEILAKGVNMLSKILELLIRFRCFNRTWNTDISKLYNQLHLNESSLAFSLFLYHQNLDQNTPPTIWVMSRAWYGVSSTGNQAGVAIEFLAHQFKEVHPAAHSVLLTSRYVDDILSGAESEEQLEEQIRQTQECLKAGGFTLKYVARSGHKPPPKAAADGVHVGCLGLAWNTEKDTLSLAFNEDFFLKRLKGKKLPPDKSLKDSDVLDEALNKDLITRAGILSRVAELYDPCGWWEPIKVQMKLAMQHLNGLDWNDPVPPECRKDWVSLFHIMNQLKSIHLKRSIIPENAVCNSRIRVITVADAATKSCGCAMYAGVEETKGSYSCTLIMAKSKMVHGTIPRNELEGVVLAAESSLMVQRALAEKMESIRYYTDSRIVVCWVLNESRRLRMWAFNRVQAIHLMIKRMKSGEEVVPLYHINGIENIADLLTKVRLVRHSDLQTTSEWHTGLKWMTLPSNELPCDQFIQIPEDLADVYNQEVFQEVDSLHTNYVNEARQLISTQSEYDLEVNNPALESFTVSLSPETWFMFKFKFKELGWQRAFNKLRLVLKACNIFKHGRHKLINASWSRCYLCRGDQSFLLIETDRVINWAASRQTEVYIPKKRLDSKFHLIENTWYSKSRLEKEGPMETKDLDCSPFFDHQHIKKLLPIVFVKLDIFKSYLAFIHMVEFPHMGVESTLRRIKERFYPVGNSRADISIFRAKCSKCRLMAQKTVVLELAQFPLARTTVAPPFWSVQLDIAMSFKAKPTIKSRKTFPCHALIIVCLLTSATNILAMDGLTTQAVIQAIERHASRYGIPGHLYVDSGTQLEKLQDANFMLRDVQMNIAAHRFKITVAVPKAHQQQGRVEAKVKIMRKMLAAWAKSNEECNTLLGWETVFAKVASAIDDVPIAQGSANASYDLGWEIITPNRLKMGRNNHRQLEGPIKLDNCPQTQLERNQLLTARWYEIFIERLSLLTPPPARVNDQQPKVGDVVLFLFTDPNFKKLWIWKLGILEEAMSRSSYKVRYSGSDGEKKYVQRAVGQISVIVPVDQL
jgi:competence transcription factor ComK